MENKGLCAQDRSTQEELQLFSSTWKLREFYVFEFYSDVRWRSPFPTWRCAAESTSRTPCKGEKKCGCPISTDTSISSDFYMCALLMTSKIFADQQLNILCMVGTLIRKNEGSISANTSLFEHTGSENILTRQNPRTRMQKRKLHENCNTASLSYSTLSYSSPCCCILL